MLKTNKNENYISVKRFTKPSYLQVINKPKTSLKCVNNMTLDGYAQINSFFF